MTTKRNGRHETLSLRSLTQREIDEWIQHLIVEVAAGSGEGDWAGEGHAGTRQPRWIPPGELVRRMSRFLSHN